MTALGDTFRVNFCIFILKFLSILPKARLEFQSSLAKRFLFETNLLRWKYRRSSLAIYSPSPEQELLTLSWGTESRAVSESEANRRPTRVRSSKAEGEEEPRLLRLGGISSWASELTPPQPCRPYAPASSKTTALAPPSFLLLAWLIR